MDSNPIFAVIDLGSYETVGMVGRKDDGKICPIAYTKEPSSTAVRHGYVCNIDSAATLFDKIITKLSKEEYLGENRAITKVYVGVGAQSLNSTEVVVERSFEEDIVITQELLQEMRDEASQLRIAGKDNLLVTTPTYLVNDVQEKNPKGMPCKSVKAFYQVITARESIRKNIEIALKRINVTLVDILVSPIALADITMTEANKTLGCCQIDLGAGKTSVCIYKNLTPVALYILPMGGQNVTTDLTSLRFLERDAEKFKIEKGSMVVESDRNKGFTFVDQDKTTERKIRYYDFTKITSSRMKEIFANILNIITCSGMQNSLDAGLQITGGGAKLSKFKDFMIKNLECVADVTLRKDMIIWDKPDIADPKCFTALGLLRLAKEDCVDINKNISDLFESEESAAQEAEQKEDVQDPISALWAEDDDAVADGEYDGGSVIIQDDKESEDEMDDTIEIATNSQKQKKSKKEKRGGIGSTFGSLIHKALDFFSDDEEEDMK